MTKACLAQVTLAGLAQATLACSVQVSVDRFTYVTFACLSTDSFSSISTDNFSSLLPVTFFPPRLKFNLTQIALFSSVSFSSFNQVTLAHLAH